MTSRRSFSIFSRGHIIARHSKHPDWDNVWKQLQNRDWSWLSGYIKSHDINQCTDEHSNTLLHHAVRDKNLRAITDLSHFFIDPNIKNAAGQTALQLSQDAECLWTLHEYHLCIDFATASTKPNGLDALFAAIYRGDATLGDTSDVKNDGNEGNAGGWTALHCAVWYDRPHLIRALHQRFPKLDPDCLNYDKCSALRLAARHGHSNCIIALCECFPAIKAGDALQDACEYNHPACIPTLRECFPHLTGNELAHNFRCSSALMCAAFHNNPECIRALHSCFSDIDPNLQDDHGNTVLFAAVDRPENSNCIPVLSECFPNIDLNKQDNNGDTALMYACELGFSQSVTLFATHFPSIDVNMRGNRGRTALMWAIKRNDEKCLMTLCESFPNIDPNAQDKFGWTALMIAANHSNPGPIIPQLLKCFPGIDPNVQNQSGQTALMFAVRPRYQDAVLSQLRKVFPNIDPNKQDKRQNTALMYLLQSLNCSVKSVSFFLDTFPNVDAKIQNDRGETALTIAIEKNDILVVKLLLWRFPDTAFLINSAGKTALILATEKNNHKLILMLLKHMQ